MRTTGHRTRRSACFHCLSLPPHGWDAGVCYDETTETLLCGDRFMAVGPAPSFRATAATNSAVKHFYRDRLAAQS